MTGSRPQNREPDAAAGLARDDDHGNGIIRTLVIEATVATVYRHACNDAAAAASAHDWAECARLLDIARQIAQAYPGAAARARFAPAENSPAGP